MKNKFILLFFLLLSGLFLTVNGQTVKELTTQEFKDQIWNYDKNKEWKFDGKKPVIIDLYATWCGPCQRLGPVMEQLAEDYEDQNVVIGKVDVDQEPGLAQRFGVMNIPTVIFFRDGEELERKVGAMPIDDYTQTLDENL